MDSEIHNNNNNNSSIAGFDNSSVRHTINNMAKEGGSISESFDSENGSSIVAMTMLQTWGYAFLFVTVINLSSIMGIIFFPLMKKSFYTIVMRTMIGLAIGSLTGSALFHLIPAAFDLDGTNAKGQQYVNIAVFIWFSMWIVMLLECTIKIVVKTRAAKADKKYARKNAVANQSKNNNQSGIPLNHVSNSNSHMANGDASQIEKGYSSDSDGDEEDETGQKTPSVHSLKTSQGQLPVYHSTFSLNKRALDAVGESAQRPQAIKTVAWLIIIGDSLHNFIDGVSIGAGFVKDFRTGAIISLAIICEEFPHELGDFAILINSGFSVKKALLVNFLSALTCYLGMALGIILGEIDWANYIFAFAAGIFLYVSLADMIPEITTLIEEVSEISPKKAWKVLLSHNIGILVGITILYMLAVFQPQ